MKKGLIIFGTSSLAENLFFYIQNDIAAKYEVRCFTKSEAAIAKDGVNVYKGYPVLPFEDIEKHYSPNECDLIIAIGYAKMNDLREHFFNLAKNKGYKLANYICSNCILWPDLELGENVIMFDRNILQPFVKIGNGVILSRGNSIGHNSKIEDFAFITNHVVLCGFNTIKQNAFLGSNSTIADNVIIGKKTLVGAASFINRDTNENSVFISQPTKSVDKKSSEFFNW
jgi:sugar O-acyltransferase (sialic acid O-acetyltransferase NeuD family)